VTPPEHRPAAARPLPPSRRDRARTVAGFGLGAIAALFAVLNLDEVKVSWIVGTWETPLIIVIALSIVLGAAIGWLLARRRAGGSD
jgi:uncharacterized integral membrane protein